MRVTFAQCHDSATVVAHPEILKGILHTDEACPDCGAPLTIHLAAERVSADGRTATVRAAACCGCEFIREM